MPDLFFRPHTWDFDIWRSVFDNNEYGLSVQFPHNAAVIDVGAHIGAFTYTALHRGASFVLAVEPVIENARLWHHNIHRACLATDRAVLVTAAAWREADALPVASTNATTELPIGPNTGAPHVLSTEGHPVRAVPFDQLVDLALAASGQPRITLLKLDCEGSEWPILFTSKRLDVIDEIIGEYHLLAAGLRWDGPATPESLTAHLEAAGFQCRFLETDARGIGHFHAWRTRPLSSLIVRPIPLFSVLGIETQGYCNRRCPTCIRNSDPNRERTASWFQQGPSAQLPTETIHRILDEAAALGYCGTVVFQHYDEPLLDPRLPDLLRYARRHEFSELMAYTNADFLTPELAHELDGLFDRLVIALYMDEPMKSEREAWIRGLFSKTQLKFTGGVHCVTHYSPSPELPKLIAQAQGQPCIRGLENMIINHKGDMAACCDDVTGNFGLGNIHNSSLEELWFSSQHVAMVKTLAQPGGRRWHPFCSICPRLE